MYQILAKLFEHLRVWFRLSNLVMIGGRTVRVIPTPVVLVILLTNVTVITAAAIGMLMAVGMYVLCPTHLCEQCGSPRTVNSATTYTNCIQLETIFYYTDVMLGFHHFLFKVVIK